MLIESIPLHLDSKRILKTEKISRLFEYGEEIDIKFVVLEREHKDIAEQFRCGNDYIDKFVRSISYKDKETVTHAAIDVKNNQIIAILTLVATGIYTEPSKLSKREKMVISAVEIRYYAVDKRYQKMPYSQNKSDNTLSYQIFNKYIRDIFELSKHHIGIKKIILYSVDEAVDFYKRSNFHDFKKYMVRLDKREIRGCVPMYFNLNV